VSLRVLLASIRPLARTKVGGEAARLRGPRGKGRTGLKEGPLKRWWRKWAGPSAARTDVSKIQKSNESAELSTYNGSHSRRHRRALIGGGFKYWARGDFRGPAPPAAALPFTVRLRVGPRARESLNLAYSKSRHHPTISTFYPPSECVRTDGSWPTIAISASGISHHRSHPSTGQDSSRPPHPVLPQLPAGKPAPQQARTAAPHQVFGGPCASAAERGAGGGGAGDACSPSDGGRRRRQGRPARGGRGSNRAAAGICGLTPGPPASGRAAEVRACADPPPSPAVRARGCSQR